MPDALAYDRNFYDRQSNGSLASARVILPEILSLVGGASLVDVGCGVGPWLKAAQECGMSGIVGLDGDYVDRSQLLTGTDLFRQCDLETEDMRNVLQGLLPFDLAVCVEVAEHLTPGRAGSFVSELCQLSDMIVFSAAVPGQGGTGHVNEQ